MIRLQSEKVRLAVSPEFGSRWMRLQVRIHGRWIDLLVPSSADRLQTDPLFDGAYLLAPWCNRIPDARFRFKGREHRLKPNFPDGSAIHGDVWGRAWAVKRKSGTSLETVLDSRLQKNFNFPWPVVVRHGVRITARGVSAWIYIRNAGTARIPAGLGFHPFLARAANGEIVIPAKRYFPSINAVPSGVSRPVTETDYSLAAAEIDCGFTKLAGNVRIDTKAGYEVVLSSDAGHLFVWAPHRFRGKAANFLCVEPMTMCVDGFRRKERGARDSGVRVLRPGETLTMRWRLEARAVTSSRTSATRS